MLMSRSVISRISPQAWTAAVSRTKGDNLISRSTKCRPPDNLLKRSFCKQHASFLSSCRTSFITKYTLAASPFSTKTVENIPKENKHIDYLDCSDSATRDALASDMIIVNDFITEDEEQSIFVEIEPYIKRLRYEFNHWDNAIHGYRETERKNWNVKNRTTIQRIREKAFPPGVSPLAFVHVLDLSKEGYIRPHVDAVKFCGSTIAGISLLSSAVMRLTHTDDKTKSADVLIKQRSLYIMKDDARYNYTHEVLPDSESIFKGVAVPRHRRISIICRNEPSTT